MEFECSVECGAIVKRKTGKPGNASISIQTKSINLFVLYFVFCSVPKVKRQEHIYEIIMTEKHHCQILLLMQKVFVESLQRHFSQLNPERLFPRLAELTDMHTG